MDELGPGAAHLVIGHPLPALDLATIDRNLPYVAGHQPAPFANLPHASLVAKAQVSGKSSIRAV
jgi:hypothetical protein